MEMYKDMRGWWMSVRLSCHMTQDEAMPQIATSHIIMMGTVSIDATHFTGCTLSPYWQSNHYQGHCNSLSTSLSNLSNVLHRGLGFHHAPLVKNSEIIRACWLLLGLGGQIHHGHPLLSTVRPQ